MSNQLLNKYTEIISSLKATNLIKVISVEEIKDNEVFLRLRDLFESYFSEIIKPEMVFLISSEVKNKLFVNEEMIFYFRM